MYGSLSEMIKEALKRKDNKNLHILHFEDSKSNPEKEISRLNDFLNTNLSNEQISKVTNALTYMIKVSICR